MTLEDKVFAVVTDEAPIGRRSPFEFAGTFPDKPEQQSFTSFELDCRDWGFAFGVAYGIARSEAPFESAYSIGERALEAAQAASLRWGNTRIFSMEAFKADRAEREPIQEPATNGS